MIDFDNSRRKIAVTKVVPFSECGSPSIFLPAGAYTVEFNEWVDMPLDVMGQVFPRSSLWRSGATISTGVVDSGYVGALGAQLQVWNAQGLQLYAQARLAQIVCHKMEEKVEGYDGVYQESQSL